MGEEVLEVNSLDSGTCAVVAFVHNRELFVAGVGDCRCVLGTVSGEGNMDETMSAIVLSTDHKCDLPTEKARIEAKGGYVRPAVDAEDDFVPARLYEKEGRPDLGPGLCISRSLSDASSSSS